MLISESQARSRLESLPGWLIREGTLRREFVFGGFAEAIAFTVRVGFAAEAANHHPDILVSYRRVSLTYVTHSAGGLTEKDFAGAALAERMASEMGRR